MSCKTSLCLRRLRKSSFISRQRFIHNFETIFLLLLCGLFPARRQRRRRNDGARMAKVILGTFTVFFFYDFWCVFVRRDDDNEKSPQASTSFQACVRIHLSPTVPDNTSFVETVWSESFLINIYVHTTYVHVCVCISIKCIPVLCVFMPSATRCFSLYWMTLSIGGITHCTPVEMKFNDVCITSVVSRRIRLRTKWKLLNLIVHTILWLEWSGGAWIGSGCGRLRMCEYVWRLENISISLYDSYNFCLSCELFDFFYDNKDKGLLLTMNSHLIQIDN